MSKVKIRIPTPLRSLAGGAADVEVEGATVREALASLGAQHGKLLESVLDGDGNLRSFVNVFIEDENIKQLDGLDSALGSGKTISIIPAVAGGGRRPAR